MLKKHKVFFTIVLSFIIITLPVLFYVIKQNQKPTFELMNQNIIGNYTIVKENKTYNGKLYELDYLYTGNISSTTIQNYVEQLKLPENAIAITVKFYSNYNKDLQYQIKKNLKYEVHKEII